jgi:hypothetical protein
MLAAIGYLVLWALHDTVRVYRHRRETDRLARFFKSKMEDRR